MTTLNAEKNLAIMAEIKKLIGEDIPWAREEEMLNELAQRRRLELNLQSQD